MNKSRKLSDLDRIEVCNLFQTGNFTMTDLARKYNISISVMCKFLNRMGFKAKPMSELKRKYNLNRSFFNKIDTEEKAYWLGFLYADGYIHQSRGEIKIQLANKDIELLEKFNKSLSSNYPILYYKANAEILYPRILITCKELVNDLIKLGCTQAKSHTLNFPTNKQVPKHLIHHFIRGYFDGDGGFSKSSINFTGRELFLNTIHEKMNCKSYIYFRIRHPERKNDIGSSTYTGTDIKLIYNYLYSNATIYLERKKEIIENYLPKLRNKTLKRIKNEEMYLR